MASTIDGTSLNTVNGVAATNTTKPTKATTAGGALDKDAFLQLLVTQMGNQDPLNPQDNSQQIAQLAQFSSLEQMTNMVSGITKVGNLVQNMDTSVLVGQVSSMIGKTIQWSDDGGKTKLSGTVTSVSLSSGVPTIVTKVTGDDTAHNVSIGNITQIGA